ncbi:hypothetical protein GQ457_08G008340 [Hibiscus cannabinus]
MEEAKENLSRVTLFVENIPSRMQWRGLWHMFARHGKVIPTFIAKKLSRGSKRFGFVEFGNEEDSNRAMERLNGFITYGFRLTVKAARQRNSKNSEEKKSPVNEQKRMHIRVEKEEDQQRAEDQKLKEINVAAAEGRIRSLDMGNNLRSWAEVLSGPTPKQPELLLGSNSGLGLLPKAVNQELIEETKVVDQPIGGTSSPVDKEQNLDLDFASDREMDSLDHFGEMDPVISIKKNSFPVKKYGSLWDLQDRALFNIEKKRRDRGVRRNKRNKKISEDIQGLELSGRSLSDSDLRIKWERAKLEAKATLELGKKIGMSIRGSEEEAVRELSLLKFC